MKSNPARTALFAALFALPALGASSAIAAAAATPTASLIAPAQAPASPLERRVDDAFIAAFPLYEMARSRFNAAVNPLNPHPFLANGAPAKRRSLIDHTARDVTTPNNDTLYVATWLDLRNTPVRVQMPKVGGGRYYSITLLDIYTNNFAILGRQKNGDGPIDVLVVGPDWKGALPKGQVVRSPSNDVQLVGRYLVNGKADAPEVHALQDALKISQLLPAAKPLPQWVPVNSSTDPANFLAVVNEMLSRNPLPKAEAAAFAGWSDLGIGGGAYAFIRSSPEVQAAWRARLPVLHEALKVGLQHGSRLVAGWGVPPPHVGNFGTDTNLRAAVAFGALSALAASEAIYLNLETDPAGKPLDGSRRWKLVVPQLQARAFWSLSMYEKDADGRLFFAANPLSRYSIGDRTPGVKRLADGSIELLLQHDAPAGGDTSNWLPAPKGAYAVTLRAYLPTDAMRRGEAPLPRLVAVD